MKKTSYSNLFKQLLIIFPFIAIDAFATEYNINFTASGASSTIDYITVQNLTQGTSVTVPAGNTLEVTSVSQVAANSESLYIYPNPIRSKATGIYYTNSGGNTSIKVFGVDGRSYLEMDRNLSVGFNYFELSIPKGAYVLQIIESGKRHVAKILSQSENVAGLEFAGNVSITNVALRAKAINVPIQYNLGDLLFFKAYAGNHISILTDIFSGNKTINFNFVECKDVDGNYYPIVSIGKQVWMAENLKTSKFRNSIPITDKTNLTTWGTSLTEAFSDYLTPSNSTTYGKFYNWYAVSDTNNIAPLGWHMPTDAEWTTLSNLIGGLNIAGDKLKENGNSHWATANTTATNNTGFTALPGGSRSTDSNIYDIGNIGYWWSFSEGSTTNNAWYRSLSNQNGTLTRGYFSKSSGMSVRCIIGDLPIINTKKVITNSSTSSIAGGNITFNGNLDIIARGVCWNTTTNPTVNDSKTNDGTGNGEFSSSVTNLEPNNTYCIRAYATNSFGTSYGASQIFSTKFASVSTSNPTSITINSAVCTGTVTAVGGAEVTSRGICWSTSPNPTIELSTKINVGSGVGTFVALMIDLTLATKYYVRSYATNAVGTSYGNEISFTTQNGIATFSTTTTSSILAFSATIGVNITADGGTPITARGICYSISPSPTLNDSLVVGSGSGTGSFSSNLSGLTQGVKYYVRPYATNAVGTSYGNEISFTTQNGIATFSTTTASSILAFSATIGGNITADGGTPITARGICYSSKPSPTLDDSLVIGNGSGTGSFSSNLSGLTQGVKYYVRPYATNAVGTSYGNEISFTTKNGIASLSTTTASSVLTFSATIGGNITADGGTPITARGICYSTSPSPTIKNYIVSNGSGTGFFSSNLSGLTHGVKYYVRSYATNIVGTSYGNEISFTTQDGIATFSTTTVSSILAFSATIGGNIIFDGGTPITARGICYSSNPSPTLDDSLVVGNGSGTGTFTSNLSGLTQGVKYYVRPYATNAVGTSYGNEISFTTQNGEITIKTTLTNSMMGSTASSGAVISADGGTPVIERGVCWSTSPNPNVSLSTKTSDGTGTGTFTSSISGLVNGTTYYLKSYARNLVGIKYGDEISFISTIRNIGDNYAGGIIFYFDNTGQHGFVCATTDQSNDSRWGSMNSFKGATQTDIGSGLENTNKMILGTSLSSAANFCVNLSLNSYNDWYLPSRDELTLMISNLKSRGLGAFSTTGNYWSSSEIDIQNAWSCSVGNNSSYKSFKDAYTYYNVRAIRSF